MAGVVSNTSSVMPGASAYPPQEASKAAFGFSLSAAANAALNTNATQHQPKRVEEQMMSSMLNSSPSSVSTQDVAYNFVEQYYTVLHDEPSNLHLFYDADSHYHRLMDCSGGNSKFWKAHGQQAIYEGFKYLLTKHTTANIRVIEEQESIEGGIFLLVSGTLKAIGQQEREFVQSVYLGKQKLNRKGWYIKNEIFYFLDAAHAVEEAPSQTNMEASALVDAYNAQQDATTNNYTVNGSTYKSQEEIVEASENEGENDVTNELETLPEAMNDLILKGTIGKEHQVQGDEINCDVAVGDAGSGSNLYREKTEAAQDMDIVNTSESTVVDAVLHNSSLTVKHWGEVDRNPEAESNSNWPTLRDVVENKNHENKQQNVNVTIVDQYDANSFASKLMKNMRWQKGIQRGYAIKPKKVTEKGKQDLTGTEFVKEGSSSELENTAASNEAGNEDEQGEDGAANGLNRRKSFTKPKEGTKKLMIRGLPEDATDASIKRSIALRLKAFNDGHVVEVKLPFIELDCRQSAEFLVNNGWHYLGEKMNVVYANRNPRREFNDKPQRGAPRPNQGNSSTFTRGREEWVNRGNAQQFAGSKIAQSGERGRNVDVQEAANKGGNNFEGSNGAAELNNDGWVEASKKRRDSRNNNAYNQNDAMQRRARNGRYRNNGHVVAGVANSIDKAIN